MQVPRSWARSHAIHTDREGKKRSLAVWGWGEGETEARQNSSARLARLVERLGRGEPPGAYEYGSRPLREEILETLPGEGRNEPAAILTRNRHGAIVLNTAFMLFLDIDLEPPNLGKRLLRLVTSAPPADSQALTRLREALVRHGRASFRIYRTAAGFRALAVDREFDPAGREAQELMVATGTDPAFAKLCLLQQSFRARLSPKPWRCNCKRPPGEYPRDEEQKLQFADWLSHYEQATAQYATCQFLESVGPGRPEGRAKRLVELHDRHTRCEAGLPLA